MQRRLIRAGQWIPGITRPDADDLAQTATISVSSELRFSGLPASEQIEPLAEHKALVLPATRGKLPKLTFFTQCAEPTELEVQLRGCSRRGAYTPDTVLERKTVTIGSASPPSDLVTDSANGHSNGTTATGTGEASESGLLVAKRVRPEAKSVVSPTEQVTIEFDTEIDEEQYVFCCLKATRTSLSSLQIIS